jgi:8-oxo-dGTP diphosphatase
MTGARIAAVGAVVRDDQERILLVRRGREPGRGQWSIPGGRVEAGETAQQALVREVAEETGLRVAVTGPAGRVERPGPGGITYEIEDFYADVTPEQSHRPEAGDDADDVGWFPPTELERLDCVDGLVEALSDWGVLPTPPGAPGPA